MNADGEDDDGEINKTIGTASVFESEDENGKYLTEHDDIQLFSTLKSIRENKPRPYSTKEEDDLAEDDEDNDGNGGNPKSLENSVNKEQLVNDYFDSLIQDTPKKQKKVIKESETFLRDYILSQVWKAEDRSAASSLADDDIYDDDDEEEEEEEDEEDEEDRDDEYEKYDNNMESSHSSFSPLHPSSSSTKTSEIKSVKKLYPSIGSKKKSALVEVPRYHFLEESGKGIIKYPKFTQEDGSLREKKPSRKSRERQKRNERFKTKLEREIVSNKRYRAQLRREIIDLVRKLKEYITGDGSLVDHLQLSNNDEDFQQQQQNGEGDDEAGLKFDKKNWKLIEAHSVYEELCVSDIMEDEDEEVKRIRREIRRKFDDFYSSYHESYFGNLKFRMRYVKIPKDKSKSVEEILNEDDEESHAASAADGRSYVVNPYRKNRWSDDRGDERTFSVWKQSSGISGAYPMWTSSTNHLTHVHDDVMANNKDKKRKRKLEEYDNKYEGEVSTLPPKDVTTTSNQHHRKDHKSIRSNHLSTIPSFSPSSKVRNDHSHFAVTKSQHKIRQQSYNHSVQKKKKYV